MKFYENMKKQELIDCIYDYITRIDRLKKQLKQADINKKSVRTRHENEIHKLIDIHNDYLQKMEKERGYSRAEGAGAE